MMVEASVITMDPLLRRVDTAANVYLMTPANMVGLVWRDAHGEWHPAPFGSEIYKKIAKFLPERRTYIGNSYYYTPDVPPCPESLLQDAAGLVCYPENTHAKFLPDNWRPVT